MAFITGKANIIGGNIYSSQFCPLNIGKNLDTTINKMIEDNKLSDNNSGIVFTMHVNGELGCFDIEKNINKNFPKVKSGIFCGDIPKKWVPRKDKESFNNYKTRMETIKQINMFKQYTT